MLNGMWHEHRKDVPSEALLVPSVLPVHERADASIRQLLLTFDQIPDRLALGWMRVHVQEPSDAFRLEEASIEGEGRSQTHQRIARIRGRVPQIQDSAVALLGRFHSLAHALLLRSLQNWLTVVTR